MNGYRWVWHGVAVLVNGENAMKINGCRVDGI